jgi:hypothetical protein
MIPQRVLRGGLRLATATFSAALLAGLPASAATFTWDNVTGNWSTGLNWAGDAAPTSNLDNELVFGGSATGYVATHDLGFGFFLNSLRLQSNALTSTQTLAASGDATLDFTDNFVNAPSLVQNGTGAFDIRIPLVLSSPTNFTGNSTGLVSLFAPISGT